MRDSDTYSSPATPPKSFLEGKKLALICALVTLMTLAENAGLFRLSGRLLSLSGIRKSDGSDGYVTYVAYVKAKADYNRAKTFYEAHENTLKGIALADAVDELRSSQRAYEKARKAFFPELARRAAASGAAPITVRTALMTADAVPTLVDNEENNKPVTITSDDKVVLTAPTK